MIGTITNVAAIVAGTVLGCLLQKGIPGPVKKTVMQGISLTIVLIGLQMAMQTKSPLIVIVSMVLGGITGEMINIEKRLNQAGCYLEKRLGGNGNGIARAFVASSLIYCVGAMAVVGSIQDGLTGQPATLFAKSMLDGTTAIFFASTMGVGVIFSAIPVLLYQGGITLGAALLKGILSPPVIAEITATGGLLIVGIGINMLGIKEIKVGNLLPAILFAALLAWGVHSLPLPTLLH
ncbi:DUF554 domain-containing protein [Desulfotomaculum copahuensis]|uniref:DUF554 domain-containing protein n=1 Tax=Desulfotomaculum copahuensis TaxID=1838280 RepID=A0A1B7LAV6_9FIRM|nr:DUF554 domain-containing protein [Desulfotomaculum copahuensis]OAT79477.1 hypothetical protein A6M21_15855 [Desulfotomaculum copahuensis]